MIGFLRRLWWRVIGFEVIDGNGQCPPYLYRWRLFASPWGKVYLHHFVGDDWSRDPHDHPKAFLSIGLAGEYDEDVFDESGYLIKTIRWRAPWWRSFPARHVHLIRSAHTNGAWTLVCVGRSTREWGFVTEEGWLPWREYIYEGHSRKSC